MNDDVMVMLGLRWCDGQTDLFADELIQLFRQKTEGELAGVPPSVARSVWNRAISRLFLEVNLPEDLYEQTLCGNRDQRLFADFESTAGNEVLEHLLSLAEDVRAWGPRSEGIEKLAGEHGRLQREFLADGHN
jgi:hypothetical protein